LDFRNIEHQTLDFDEGVNLICGYNGQGKTNALEGIYLMAQGRSHRTLKDRDFIRFGQNSAEIILEYSTKRRDHSELKLKFKSDGKKFCRSNGVPIARMSEFIGNFRAIIFTPEHLSVVKSGPSHRRLFLDSALSQISVSYVSDLQNYNRCLAQRNKLLQTAEYDMVGFSDTVGIWSEKLAEYGARISAARAKYVKELEEVTEVIFNDMTGRREKLRLAYSEQRDYEQFLNLFTANIDKELKYRITMYGVHKDDIGIEINGKSAREFGSQGQQRSAALAMKLGEGELSKEKSGEYPVFLLDDILSELDKKRREYVIEGISGRQVIITSCYMNEVGKNAKIFYCENGRFFDKNDR